MQLSLLPGIKERGAFFTPPHLARFLTDWAVQSPNDRVLEPACGEAEFLLAICERLQNLGALDIPSQVKGVEIHEESATTATSLLAAHGSPLHVEVRDFFECEAEPTFDAVVGNPPYVRYQGFTGEMRSKAQEVALRQGVELPGLASSWAAFVVHSAAFLRPEGRLGLVLPAELLTVNYAAPIRSFLMRRFSSVKLVLFEARVFPGVSEEVLLLLAQGEGPTTHCELFQAKDAADLSGLKPNAWIPAQAEEKWTAGLLPPAAQTAYQVMTASGAFSTLQEWGETDLGMVTGKNQYFALDGPTVEGLGLKRDEVLRISPPGSRHLRGFSFTDAAWSQMEREGSRTYLFHPGAEPSPRAKAYIKLGEEQGVYNAYKCRMRKPWWQVPLVQTPDLFLTYMNHGAPRLIANAARVRSLNSTHGVILARKLRQRGAKTLPIAFLNSVTQLSAELVGRSYGGGVLKLEPREADKLLVPSPALIEERAGQLDALRPQLGRLLRGGKVEEAVHAVDRIVLPLEEGRLERVKAIREAREFLFSRRVARGGS